MVRSLRKKAKRLHTPSTIWIPTNQRICLQKTTGRYISSIIKSDHLPTVMRLHSHTAFFLWCLYLTYSNVFFESVYSKSDDHQSPVNLRPSHTSHTPVDTLGIINITDFDVYTLLTSTKAQGIGAIGAWAKILRSCSPALYVVIHHLFTMSLCHYGIENSRKVHCIVPIFKSGDKSFTNYRPISLLCCISKVLERLVYDKHLWGAWSQQLNLDF